MTIPRPKFHPQQPVTWHETYYLTDNGDLVPNDEFADSLLACCYGECQDPLYGNGCAERCVLAHAVKVQELYRGFVISRDFPDLDELEYGVPPEWVYAVELTSVERWDPEPHNVDLSEFDTIYDVVESELVAIFQPAIRDNSIIHGVVRISEATIFEDCGDMELPFLITMRLTHTPSEVNEQMTNLQKYDPYAVILEPKDWLSLPASENPANPD